MGITPLTQVWGLKIPQNEKLVLLAMVDHAHNDGSKIFPGIAHIAWKTGYHPNQVRNLIASLVTRKLLVVCEQPPGKPTVYRFQPSAVERTPEPKKGKSGRPKNTPTTVEGEVNTPTIAIGGGDNTPTIIEGEQNTPTIDNTPIIPENTPTMGQGNDENTPTTVEGEKGNNRHLEPSIEPKEKDNARAYTHEGNTSPPTLPALTGLLEKPSDIPQPRPPADAQTTEPPSVAPVPPEPSDTPEFEPHEYIVGMMGAYPDAKFLHTADELSKQKTWEGLIKLLIRADISPYQLQAYLKAMQLDPFWKGKQLPVSTIENNIGIWLATHKTPRYKMIFVPIDPLHPPEDPNTPPAPVEDIERGLADAMKMLAHMGDHVASRTHAPGRKPA